MSSIKHPFPSSSKIRYYSAFFVSGINVIVHEGWGVFWRKLQNKTRQLFKWGRNPNQAYKHWISELEPTKEALDQQKSLPFNFRPTITLLTPIDVNNLELLNLTVNSLIKQTYNNWELFLIIEESSLKKSEKIIQQFTHLESRVKIEILSKKSSTSRNYCEFILKATGEFFGFLDAGDELAPFALFDVVQSLNDNPDVDFIYSDEDKIDMHQKRAEPFFKPDWSPDMILSFWYTGHLSLYRKRLAEKINDLESANDREYSLVLRIMEYTHKIHHIPRILYHRRIVNGKPKSPLFNLNNESEKRFLTEYLERNHIPGRVVDGLWPGSYRVKRKIIDNPLVSIIIPAKDKVDLTRRCINSILNLTEYTNYEILIVDNQSSQTKELVEYYQTISKQPKVKIIEYNFPFNFSALNNYAVAQSKGVHLLFLNNDTEIINGEWLSAMLEQSQRKEVGAVGAKLLFPDGSIQHCGVIIGPNGFSGHAFIRQPDTAGYFGRINIIANYSAITAACVMIRRNVFLEMSGFDENLAVAYNDIDLCLRMREKGYLIVYTPYARLYHLESFTRGYTLSSEVLAVREKEYQYVVSRWKEVINRGDPYYNPNLSLTNIDFSIEDISRLKNKAH